MIETKGIPLYQVDAFTNSPFKGNPAAVCLLEKELDETLLLNIASEMNLSETAFIYVKNIRDASQEQTFQLRWFTPQKEVRLCGHATLAAATILFNIYSNKYKEIHFNTLSGELRVKKGQQGFEMNFPEPTIEKINLSKEFLQSLQLSETKYTGYSHELNYVLIEIKGEKKLKNLQPNFTKLLESKLDAEIALVVITARSKGYYDFISRSFAPWFGINEDPVTGSSHTILSRYWREQLNKSVLKAFQCSKRGGEVIMKKKEKDKIIIIGNSQIVFEGTLKI